MAYREYASHATLKKMYDAGFEKLWVNWFPETDWLKKEGRIKKIKAQGASYDFAVETMRGSGAGFTGESEILATADPTTSAAGSVPLARGLKGRIQITAESLILNKGKGAFIDSLKQETEGMIGSIQGLAGPALWGDGRGVLALIPNQMIGTATMTVTEDDGIANSSGMVLPGTRWLFEGMRVNVYSDVGNTADGTFAHTTVIDKIVDIPSSTVATLGGVNGTAAGTRYVGARWGAGLGTTYYKGPTGFLAMCTGAHLTGATYLGISQTTYPQWSGVVNNNNGTNRALTISLLYRLWAKLARKAGTFDLKVVCWTSPDMILQLVDLLEHFVEFKATQLEAGWKKLTVSMFGQTVEFKASMSCPHGFFFLNPDYIKMLESCPLEIVAEDGKDKLRLADYDAFELRWRWMFNLMTTKRNAHGVLTDITCPTYSI
jgi:hypothetical protein